MEKVLNIKIDEKTWKQCKLPVRYGGLGVRSTVDVSLPAFLSSTFASQKVSNSILPDDLKDKAYEDQEAAVISYSNKEGISHSNFPTVKHIQRNWDAPLCEIGINSLINESINLTEKARLLAVSAEHSGDWLNAIPIPSLGLKLDNNQLRISCGLRLGTILCHPHKCVCGSLVDELGTHGLSCKKSSGRYARHAHINDLIRRSLQSINVPSTLEPLGLSRDDGKRPDGMTLFPWKKGKIMVWDYTCSDTLAKSYIQAASKNAGKIAEEAESRKIGKYQKLLQNYEVIPICVETLGPWGPNGLKLIQEIGKKIQDSTKEPRSTSFLIQSISMAVQRGNSASVMGTVENQRSLEEIYYL